MLGHYKAPLHRVLDPVARLLLRMGARPNHMTVLGLGVSVAAAYVFSVGRLRWGAVLLAVAGLFDFFDGAVARLAGSDSDYGAFLDSVVDRYSDVTSASSSGPSASSRSSPAPRSTCSRRPWRSLPC